MQALEQRVESKLAQSVGSAVTGVKDLGESPKKKSKSMMFETPAKVDTGRGDAPGTITRVLSWVWGSSAAVSESKVAERDDEEIFGHLPIKSSSTLSKGKERDARERPQPMKQVRPAPVSAPPPRSNVPRSSFAPVLPNLAHAGDHSFGSASLLGLSTSSSATSSTMAVMTPAQETTTAKLYPSLNPPIGHRSAAIRKLFPEIHPLGSSSSSGGISHTHSHDHGHESGEGEESFGSVSGIGKSRDFGIRRKTSVKDLVKGFEKSGELEALLRGRSGSQV